MKSAIFIYGLFFYLCFYTLMLLAQGLLSLVQ
jgi:hypothetical protein